MTLLTGDITLSSKPRPEMAATADTTPLKGESTRRNLNFNRYNSRELLHKQKSLVKIIELQVVLTLK